MEQPPLDDLARHFEPELKSHFRNSERAFARILRDKGTPEDVAKRAAEMFDSVNAKAHAKANYKPECKVGCAYCCCVPVEVSRPEVDLLARHLRSTRSEQELATLKDRMRGILDARVRGERPRCPLLKDDETCGIYEIRPIGCRMCNSPDSNECKTYELTGVETPRKVFSLSTLLAGYTQAAVFVTLEDKHPNFMPKLELMAELLKVL